jgi:N-methylhydantoinase B
MRSPSSQFLPEIDPITFEMIKHRLWQINDEQSIAIRTISSSPIVVEGNDFNVGLFSEGGQVSTAGIGSREVRRNGGETKGSA